MSLFSSIRMAAGALQANEIALQVVGQNISNSQTPSYIREEVELQPGPTQRSGSTLLGTGVQVQGVVQKFDSFLEDRLRGAISDQSSMETQEGTFKELEGLMNQLSDTDLNNLLTQFFSSVGNVLSQPQDVPTRNLVVLQGQNLAESFQHTSDGLNQIYDALNKRVINMAGDINRLLTEVRDLNLQIGSIEGGQTGSSQAVGLRDQQYAALEELSKLIDIRVEEQPGMGVSVYAQGTYLVTAGQMRTVDVALDSDTGRNRADLVVSEINSALTPSSGGLAGLLTARDSIVQGFSDKFNDLARTLAFEFNKVYASGQGLKGYSSAVAEFPVTSSTAALDQAGLAYAPVNGAFQMIVHNKTTGLTKTTDIRVTLGSGGHNTSLQDLADAINTDVAGVTASINKDGRLTLTCNAADSEFAFANDTSGALAALGINTFFTGSGASDLGVSTALAADPALFAASTGGIGHDTDNAVAMANFLEKPLASKSGQTLPVLTDGIFSDLAQASSVTTSLADGARSFAETLSGQKLAVSGVNIDDEAVQMMAYQRAFQAASRYIAALNELFDVLVKI